MKLKIPGMLVLLALLVTGPVEALDPDEVREYGDVFSIAAQANNRSQITVRWNIAPDYYLYNNKFLEFSTATPGVILGEPDIPQGKKSFDELLGEEVIKFTGELKIAVPLVSVPASVTQMALNVRSQGCLEGVLCYPPTEQAVIVSLPAASAPSSVEAGSATSSLAATDPLQDLLNSASRPALPAASGAPALLAEQAFQYEAIGFDPGTALVRFTVEPGYYLYVDKFAFRTVGAGDIKVIGAELPEGTIKDDPEFGPVPVIFDQVEIPVKIGRPAGPATELVLEADFQGCRDGDICYPPQTERVTLTLPAAQEALVGDLMAPPPGPQTGLVPQSEQGRLAQLLLDNPAGALVAFFIAGLLLAFTPCVFPMIPILSGIIAGEGDTISTGRAFLLSLIYVLAMAVTYTVAGVLAGLFGQNLQAMFQNPWVISTFVVIFIALALSMFGFYELQLPSGWQTRLTEHSNRQKGGKLWGVGVMGFLSALIVGPCVAPPLAAALIVIGESASPVLGGTALFALSLGMGVPLLIFGVSAGRFLPRAGQWMNAVKAVFGVGLLALAIWMLERILPGSIIMVLWGLLATGCAVFLGALDRLPDRVSGWRKLWKALGVALLFFAALQFVGAASGGDYWLKPLDHLQGRGEAGADHVAFREIKSLADLQSSIAASGKPVMLDFYADWCVECIRMERNTFPDPGVQELLANFQLVQADVTQHDEIDQALMREFGIIGPPAILFFGADGQELKAYRLVGYFTPEAFSSHLRAVLAAP